MMNHEDVIFTNEFDNIQVLIGLAGPYMYTTVYTPEETSSESEQILTVNEFVSLIQDSMREDRRKK